VLNIIIGIRISEEKIVAGDINYLIIKVK